MPTAVENPFFDRFDFDLARAVLGQLVKAFDRLGTAPLASDAIARVDRSPGVYQLFHRERLVYVGKDEKSLQKRLGEHYWTIRGRKNISVDDLTFRCLAIHPNWAPLTHESLLIRHYTREGTCEWNTTGFGNHDPGRRREDWQPNVFDTQFPINEKFPCLGVTAGIYDGNALLQAIKASLPFVFRYKTTNPQQWRSGHPDYVGLTTTVPRDDMPAAELLALLVPRLPGWQATIFRSHMILYKESRQYSSAVTVIS